jgi:phosphate transport system substrate-binding protein
MNIGPSTQIRVLICAAATVSFLIGGCGRSQDGASGSSRASSTIQVKGSDTMVNLAQAWAEEYKKVAPDVTVEVSGGGSGVGVAALIKGTIDLATSSRDLKPSEIEQAKKNTGKAPKDVTVGYDALAIYVHKSNPLNEITSEQITQIYAEGGSISKWSQLGVTVPGVSDDTIVRVSRQSSSGTYEFLREHVLMNKDFKNGSRDMNGSKEVVELVASTPTAIGYSGMGYATEGVKMLKVAPKQGEPGVAPSVEATLNKSYPIARSLHVYTLGEPEGAAKKYLDWLLSEPGQKIVENSGYVPVAANAADQAKH